MWLGFAAFRPCSLAIPLPDTWMSKILFAEDDVATRYMVVDLLMAAGHAVRAVADGAMALHEIRADPPDLVLLDYRMGRPDGFEVCRRLKDDPALQHLPVLILTGMGDVEDRIQGFAAGANDFVSKPFDSRELLARVQALLRLSEQGRDLNPTTGLPGGSSIDREFERRIAARSAFTLSYLDLNDFKSFNDRFGFSAANSLIASLGHQMRLAVAGTRCFAGHIGGDDFVMMTSRSEARPLVEQVQRRLAEALAKVVPASVLEAGSYLGKRRDGVDDSVALTKLIGVLLHIGPGQAPRLGTLGELAAEAKARAKGSSEAGIIEIEAGAGWEAPVEPSGQPSSGPRPSRSSRKW